ncbi:Fusaric acid resistance protein-like-domain-containing protein [Exophiala viscosa]|uniref:Fusaric acid resistance protein-like-domain-containing protein n=1 Tax=Exophiala viscosa TaxID=2486360 RepID=A0AAN6E4S4_9EURO|nr:Fusaric acid resistance protein-like-domain-containing protein [Exophiala viscosa]KAI1626551.1 Fusaric acid resistance protein-like-domain-containing protein [Exophiala viscosa]
MASGDDRDYAQNPRASLRYSSYIDPSTGARLSRTFTLHSLDNDSDEDERHDASETAPLLQPSHASHQNGGSSWQKRLKIKSKEYAGNVWDFLRSDTGKGIFKFALAYLLGSLATFVHPLSHLFGRQNSKHMVATITVYFHPARSLGSMLDAFFLATTAFLYTAVISLLSMSVAAFFSDVVHLIELGHAIVLIVFLGGGLSFVAWVKLRKNDPLVNIACSLASLGIITILTKEGAIQAGDYSVKTITQILKMIVAGVIVTTLVSILIFPISARAKLKKILLDLTDSQSDMLALITSSFLSGDETELENSVIVGINERHKKLSSTVAQNLKESKYEHYLLGTERQAFIETRLGLCTQRISQSIGGLRSAAAMQFVVIKEPAFGSGARFEGIGNTTPLWMNSLQGSKTVDDDQSASPADGSHKDLSEPVRSPAQIFELFIQNMGPAMRSLAFTLKEILEHYPFDASRNYAVMANPKFKISLERALDLYKNSRQKSIAALYGRKDMDRSRPFTVQADWEDAAACCGHFSFSLVQVAEAIKEYLVILDELQLEVNELPAGRTWHWMKFWRSIKMEDEFHSLDPDFAEIVKRSGELDLHFTSRPIKGARQQEISMWPDRSRVKQVFFQKIYEISSFLGRDDIKFSLKVGFGAILYALPSFVPSTRPIYSHWRGEWGLLSYMLVCSMTIGASNTTGFSRIQGTCLGAAIAVAAWEVSNENPFVLGFIGFIMALWTAYIIIGMGKGPMGRFILLTYNLSALYAYSLSAQDDDDGGDEEDSRNNPYIVQIAGHRVVAVISGTIWGLIVTRLIWPISARQKLKDGLSLIWLRMGLIWKRDPLATLIDGVHPDRYMNLREEFYLQKFLGKLQGLAEASKSEFEFKRQFPHATYARILKKTAEMLDAFHAMNEVIMQDPNASPGEEALLKATAIERAQLCGRISHLFSVLASSMKLEYSIPSDDLPSIEHTRDRLLAKVFAYRWNDAQEQKSRDEDYSLLYTYALVTGQLNLGIQGVLREVEELFGIVDEEALRLE